MTSRSVFHRTFRVRQIDTGWSGFAQTPAVLRWMEESEYAFLRSLGLSVSQRDDRGQYGFPRLMAAIEFHSPVAFDEELVVALRITRLDSKQIEYSFVVTRRGDEGESAAGPVASGRFVVACCRFPAGEPPYAILIPESFSGRIRLWMDSGGNGPQVPRGDTGKENPDGPPER